MSSETRLAIAGQSAGQGPAEGPPAPGPSAPDPRPLVPLAVAAAPPGPGVPPPTPIRRPGADAGITVRALRRYWPLIALFGATVGGGLAAAVWEFLPPGRQSACAVLHISDQQPIVLQATPEGQTNAAVYRQRQQQAVTSMKVLETAFANPAVAELPLAHNPNRVGELERRTKVDFKLGQEFMRITVESDTLDESLILVTAIKDAYLSEVVNKERGIWERSVAKREEALREEEAAFERNRAELARKLEPFKLRPADAAFLPHLRHSAEEKLKQKESEQRQVQARIRSLEIEEKANEGRDGNKAAVSDALIDEEIDRDPQFIVLRAKTLALEKDLAVNEEKVGPGSMLPGIVKLRDELAAARQAEAEYRKSARPRVEARLVERERDKQRVEGLARKRELDRYRDWQTALTGDIDQARAEVIRLTGAGAEVEAILQTVTRQEKQIAEDRDTIARQRREVGTAPARVSEHEPPRVVPLDEFRRRLKYSGLAGMVGFALVAAGFVGLEHRRNRVSDPEQVGELTLPVLGTLPHLDPSHHVPAARGADWAVAVEAIDTVRTMLLHAVGSTSPQVLMVTSAAPSEGKTTLSGCLAESLARAGYRTLLIDGDLRRPTAPARYGTPPGPGVAEILRGLASVQACCYRVDGLGMWVLPAGRDSAAASELLPKGGWRGLVQQAREMFDFVVVDTAPLLAVVDPLLMAPACDGVVMAVLRDVSRMDLLADAVNRLRTLGIPILGCVVHRAYQPPAGGYYYYANRPPNRRRAPSEPDPIIQTQAPPAAAG
jgi:capsular exopolysaccharide synthesis family protein